MSKGGSDCCSACTFRKSHSADNPEFSCSIRNLAIPNPDWTYCANHPQHNLQNLQIPVGAVYVHDPQAPQSRRRWKEAPDSPEIRKALVRALEDIPEIPQDEYPFGKRFDLELIQHLATLKERSAIPGLIHLLSFDPFTESDSKGPIKVNRIETVGLAIEALAKIAGSSSLPLWEHFLTYGLEDFEQKEYYAGEDILAPIRFYAVRSLGYCEGDYAMDLLNISLLDPHEEVRKFAQMEIEKKAQIMETRRLVTAAKAKENQSRWWKFWN